MANSHPLCCDCSGNSGDVNTIMLKCEYHHVCAPCLQSRAKKNPHTLLKCIKCLTNQHEVCALPYSNFPAASHSLQPVPSWSSQPDDMQTLIDRSAQFRPQLIPYTQAMRICQKQVLLSHIPYSGIWIFVDDSNIWIEAKKLVSKKKGFSTHEDPRIRIDVGKLTDVVTRGRPVAKRYLYGSEPPPIDTVWKKITKEGWNVVRHRRDIFSGKEKQIDTQLVADVTEIACSTPLESRTTIVLVTGDVNTIPAIEKVMKCSGWSVEVHMWKHAVSGALNRFAAKYSGKIKINHLDGSLEHITFTNMIFNYNSKYLQTQAKAYGVVLTMATDASKQRTLDKRWVQTIESIAEWPFQYYWLTENQKNNDVLLVFRRDKSSRCSFDLAKFLSCVRPDSSMQEKVESSDSEDSSDEFQQNESQKPDLEVTAVEEEDRRKVIPNTTQIRTFIQYDQEKNKPLQNSILCGAGIYYLDDLLQSGGDSEETETETPSSEDSQFQLVHSASRYQIKRQLYSDPCPFKYNCKHGVNCSHSHTPEHEAYFHRNSGHGNPYRKAKPCQRFMKGKCSLSKEDCDYAHGNEDAWCLKCQTEGHFTDLCRQ